METREPITFKHVLALSLSKEALQKPKEDFPKDLFPMAQCSYLSVLLELKLANDVSELGEVKLLGNEPYYSQVLPKSLKQLEDLVLLLVIVAGVQSACSQGQVLF